MEFGQQAQSKQIYKKHSLKQLKRENGWGGFVDYAGRSMHQPSNERFSEIVQFWLQKVISSYKNNIPVITCGIRGEANRKGYGGADGGWNGGERIGKTDE